MIYAMLWCALNHSVAYRNSLDTSYTLLCVFYTLQIELESGQEARILQIDFSAAYDLVNHQGIDYKVYYLCIGGSMLSILKQCL